MEIIGAFQRLYYNLKYHPEVLDSLLKNLTSTRNRQMLWSPAVMELNKEISDILSQSHALSLLKKQGAVDPDVFISMSNQLAEQLRSAEQRKEQLQKRDDDETIMKNISAVLVNSNGTVKIKLKNEQIIESGE